MKVVKWGVHGTGTCTGPGILLKQQELKLIIEEMKHEIQTLREEITMGAVREAQQSAPQ